MLVHVSSHGMERYIRYLIGQESIPAALVAQNLLRSLQGITEDSELEKEIQQNIQ